MGIAVGTAVICISQILQRVNSATDSRTTTCPCCWCNPDTKVHSACRNRYYRARKSDFRLLYTPLQIYGGLTRHPQIAKMSKSDKPSMNWLATDLHKEWKRFKQHCEFTFKDPLNAKTEVEQVNYLMTYIGDRGREIYGTFTWAPVVGDNPAEQDTLAGVYAKYEGYVKPKKNQIRATVNFHWRKQCDGEI